MESRALGAEFIGTFWLVLGGCGAAVLAADFGVGGNGTSLGLGFVGVSLAFGLTVVTGAYALGHNPKFCVWSTAAVLQPQQILGLGRLGYLECVGLDRVAGMAHVECVGTGARGRELDRG